MGHSILQPRGCPMKLIVLFLALLSQPLFAQDCIQQTKDRLCISLIWIEGPHLDQYSKNIVRFEDVDTHRAKTPSAPVKFYGWMKMGHHEHGTRPVKTNLLTDGVYENSQIFFMGGMKGTWQFKVTVGDEDFVLYTKEI